MYKGNLKRIIIISLLIFVYFLCGCDCKNSNDANSKEEKKLEKITIEIGDYTNKSVESLFRVCKSHSITHQGKGLFNTTSYTHELTIEINPLNTEYQYNNIVLIAKSSESNTSKNIYLDNNGNGKVVIEYTSGYSYQKNFIVYGESGTIVYYVESEK